MSVTTSAACTWTATSNASWITVTGGASGTGSGSVTYTAAANDGAARTGTLTIAGSTLTVTQPAAACTIAVSPSSQSIPPTGGSGTFNVATADRCSWTAGSNADWLQITAGATGAGNGVVSVAAGANSGSARTATVTIGGHAVNVSQAAAPCAFSINPTTQTIAAVGGSGSVAVTTTSGCGWSASSNADWLTVTSAANGTGSGSVTFNAAPNPTAAQRTGTLTIAGQSFTVTQTAAPAPCSYSISPASLSIPDAAGPASTALTTTPGCAWTAVSNAPWIVVSGAASGSGAAMIVVNVSANMTGAVRTGTVSIADQTFTLTQAAAVCTYAIAPGSVSVDAKPNSAPVTVTAGPGCAWTALSNVPWLTVVPPGNGLGNGVVIVGVDGNHDGPRSGTVTIAGQMFTVQQSGDHDDGLSGVARSTTLVTPAISHWHFRF